MLTQLAQLQPVPKAEKIIKGIMPVTLILFLGAPCCPILLCPATFDVFTPCLP